MDKVSLSPKSINTDDLTLGFFAKVISRLVLAELPDDEGYMLIMQFEERM